MNTLSDICLECRWAIVFWQHPRYPHAGFCDKCKQRIDAYLKDFKPPGWDAKWEQMVVGDGGLLPIVDLATHGMSF